jgi:hypothetical protein
MSKKNKTVYHCFCASCGVEFESDEAMGLCPTCLSYVSTGRASGVRDNFEIPVGSRQSFRSRREHILDVVTDLVGGFLYYDRKEDEDLPLEAIEEAIAQGEITVDEIVEQFRKEMTPL